MNDCLEIVLVASTLKVSPIATTTMSYGGGPNAAVSFFEGEQALHDLTTVDTR